MRLVTWNCCRGTYAKKVPLLNVLSPDIAIVQECAKPTHESEACLWFGDNRHQGIVVQAVPPYRLRALPILEKTPKYIIPVSVSGPVEFTLLAVWSKANQEFSYVEAVVKAVDMYRNLIVASPTVLIGDLNSNLIWDIEHPTDMNHSALVSLLTGLGLTSAYHAFHGEDHGRETRPTSYFQWKEERPYHIDYCFIPEVWMKHVHRVEIGTYEAWKQYSDHRPLLVEILPNEDRPPV